MGMQNFSPLVNKVLGLHQKAYFFFLRSAHPNGSTSRVTDSVILSLETWFFFFRSAHQNGSTSTKVELIKKLSSFFLGLLIRMIQRQRPLTQ